MTPAGADRGNFEEIAKRPNRALIILNIGSRGSISFTDLKESLNIGVGTLYYHLDALAQFVTQNDSKQYVLTPSGTEAYEYLKSRAPVRPARMKGTGPLRALREVFFLESYVETLASEPVANTGVALGIFLVLALLSAMMKIEPVMLTTKTAPITADGSLLAAVASWVAVFAVLSAAVLVLHAQRNWGALAVCTCFTFIPSTVLLILDAFRRTFSIEDLNTLFVSGHYQILAAITAVWAVAILTVSLRSAVKLTIDRSLVVTLSMLVINIGYLWLVPVLKF